MAALILLRSLEVPNQLLLLPHDQRNLSQSLLLEGTCTLTWPGRINQPREHLLWWSLIGTQNDYLPRFNLENLTASTELGRCGAKKQCPLEAGSNAGYRIGLLNLNTIMNMIK